MNSPNTTDVVFLLSNWYSGATLFALILNESPDLICNGETFPFGLVGEKEYTCSCGNILSECGFYTSVAAGMKDGDGGWEKDIFRTLPRFSKSNYINRILNGFLMFPRFRDQVIRSNPVWRKKMKEFVERHEEFMRRSTTYSAKSIYVDGTKNIRRAEILSQYGNYNSKVIHLVRDARGFCNSWSKNRGVDLITGLQAAIKCWNDYRNDSIRRLPNHSGEAR